MRDDIKESLIAYRDQRRPTGGFLEAVLENNLMGAICRADEDNQRDLFEICYFVHTYLPASCRGSKEIVTNWLYQEDGE